MSKKEEDILCALRKQFLYYSGVSEDCFLTLGEAKTNECIYYLYRVEYNLKNGYKKHLCDYTKDRVPTKTGLIPMAALRSSATLTYNLFGDDVCQIKAPKSWGIESGEYELVRYEWKHRTIGRSRANLDAYLKSGNCHLFVEMKLLEPLVETHNFSSLQKYVKHRDCPDVFKRAFLSFTNEDKKPRHFDTFQMLKHLLAIYNFLKREGYTERQKVVLLNCHWKPSDKYNQEHNNYSRRTKTLESTYAAFDDSAKDFLNMNETFQNYFDKQNLNVDLVLAICDHRKLINIIDKEKDEYLKRYDI